MYHYFSSGDPPTPTGSRVCEMIHVSSYFLLDRKFDQDLESVSTGLKRLKNLSRAFDGFIGRDDR